MDKMSKELIKIIDDPVLLKRRKLKNSFFHFLIFLCTIFGIVVLAFLLYDILKKGLPWLSVDFIKNFPSRFPRKSGIYPALLGSIMLILLTTIIAFPIGVGTAIYLEEYAGNNRFTEFIKLNIANLAGVPSIIYGLLALGLFVYFFKLGESILTAGLTLGLLILPLVVIATRESIRAIPNSIREASYALGATKWQTIRDHILPYSYGGILTGIIIGLSRAIGETAPIITVGALSFIAFLPASPIHSKFPFVSFQWLLDPFTVIPIQVFNWVSRPQAAFHLNAAAAGIVLLFMTLLMNGLAIYLRYRFRKRIKW